MYFLQQLSLSFALLRTSEQSQSRTSNWPVQESGKKPDIIPRWRVTKRTILSSELLQRTVPFKVGRQNKGSRVLIRSRQGPDKTSVSVWFMCPFRQVLEGTGGLRRLGGGWRYSLRRPCLCLSTWIFGLSELILLILFCLLQWCDGGVKRDSLEVPHPRTKSRSWAT